MFQILDFENVEIGVRDFRLFFTQNIDFNCIDLIDIALSLRYINCFTMDILLLEKFFNFYS